MRSIAFMVGVAAVLGVLIVGSMIFSSGPEQVIRGPNVQAGQGS